MANVNNNFETSGLNNTIKPTNIDCSRSHRSSTSSFKRQRQLEIEIAAEKRKIELDEEEAKLKLQLLASKRAREEVLSKKMQELAACDESDCESHFDVKSVASKPRSTVQNWLEKCQSLNSTPHVVQACPDDIPKTSFEKFMARQTVATKLPQFSGNSQEWLMFIKQYKETTQMCGLGNAENMIRLQGALKGKAREAVESILGFPENVDMVIEI
ncbi:unnamed protein product, partial [Allacma fusca]